MKDSSPWRPRHQIMRQSAYSQEVALRGKFAAKGTNFARLISAVVIDGGDSHWARRRLPSLPQVTHRHKNRVKCTPVALANRTNDRPSMRCILSSGSLASQIRCQGQAGRGGTDTQTTRNKLAATAMLQICIASAATKASRSDALTAVPLNPI